MVPGAGSLSGPGGSDLEHVPTPAGLKDRTTDRVLEDEMRRDAAIDRGGGGGGRWHRHTR